MVGALRVGAKESEDATDRRLRHAIDRELARLASLLHRHFDEGRPDSLVPVLANPRDPDSARVFLDQIRDLAQTLDADAPRLAGRAPAAGPYDDLRREIITLIDTLEERLGAPPRDGMADF